MHITMATIALFLLLSVCSCSLTSAGPVETGDVGSIPFGDSFETPGSLSVGVDSTEWQSAENWATEEENDVDDDNIEDDAHDSGATGSITALQNRLSALENMLKSLTVAVSKNTAAVTDIRRPRIRTVSCSAQSRHLCQYDDERDNCVVKCPGACGTSTGSRVWGAENFYTDDSSICRAAIHAGVINSGGGLVTIKHLPGATSYLGTTQHGISTIRYGAWAGSFSVHAVAN